MPLHYTFIFTIGLGYHSLKLYGSHSDSQGLEGLINVFESTRAKEVIKLSRSHLTASQIDQLKDAMSTRTSTICLPDGTLTV